MSMGILILGLIILIDAIVVIAVFYWGSKHDAHTSIRSEESSRAVQQLVSEVESAAQRVKGAAQDVKEEVKEEITGEEEKAGQS